MTDRLRSTDLAIVAVVSCGLALCSMLRPEARGGETGLAFWSLQLPSVCWLKSVLHVPCAACGLTRSIVLLLHGDWNASMQQHPFGAAVLGIMVFHLPPRIASACGRRREWVTDWDRISVCGIVAVASLMTIWWATTVLVPLLARSVTAAVNG